MTRVRVRVALVALLLALVLVATGSVATAAPGIPLLWYNVYITAANPFGISLVRDAHCPHPCNFFPTSMTGYALYVWHGSTKQECRDSVTWRDTMTYTPRWEPWVVGDPDGKLLRTPGFARYAGTGPQDGDYACIFWCCQPIAPLMIFHWEFATVGGDY